MGWTASGIFVQAMFNPMLAALWSTAEPTTYGATGLAADAVKAALYNSTITPDKNAAVASTGLNTGQWVQAGKEVTDTNWPAGGVALATKAFAIGTAGGGTPWPVNVVAFDAADTAGAGAVTLADVQGAFVYDDTVTAGTIADQGLCFNYFGGAQQVTGGTFTVVWDTTGIFKVTV